MLMHEKPSLIPILTFYAKVTNSSFFLSVIAAVLLCFVVDVSKSSLAGATGRLLFRDYDPSWVNFIYICIMQANYL